MSIEIPLLAGSFYHIYNRGIFKQNLFLEERNYLYFLSLLVKYICPISNIYAYVLMKNHFHFALEIKPDESCIKFPDPLSKHYSQCFSNFFNAYAKAFNKSYQRSGPLFEAPFKRKRVKDSEHLKLLINYIHMNPKWHKFMDNYREYPYSSYRSVLSAKPTNISRSLIQDLFGGTVQFKHAHDAPNDWNLIRDLVDDDPD
jgi:REP element-mobilizing transposase RayT